MSDVLTAVALFVVVVGGVGGVFWFCYVWPETRRKGEERK